MKGFGPLVPTTTIEKKIVFKAVGAFSRFFIQKLSNVRTTKTNVLKEALESGRPVITYSNHTSSMDDPLVWGCLPKRYFMNPDKIRHTLCAQEICFSNPIKSRFFSAAQGLPIMRGEGIYQECMDHAIDLLNENRWVHLYPEGKVNLGCSSRMQPFRWGIARLIRESKEHPLVIPVFHHGMCKILPSNPGWNRLHLNKNLDVVFGDAIDFSLPSLLKYREYEPKEIMDDSSKREEITRMLFDKIVEIQEAHLESIEMERASRSARPILNIIKC